jgi:hypothetical protein
MGLTRDQQKRDLVTYCLGDQVGRAPNVRLRRLSDVRVAPDAPRVTAGSPSFWHGSGMHPCLASSPSLEG